MSTRYNAEPEATVTLADGSTAYRCILESVWRLQQEGHTLVVLDINGGDEAVEVQPPSLSMNPDWLIVLGRNAAEVAAILALDHGAIH